MEHRITSRDAAAMASHWLGCPVNGYLGSGYGSDLKALLHIPMGAGLADGVVEKCRATFRCWAKPTRCEFQN